MLIDLHPACEGGCDMKITIEHTELANWRALALIGVFGTLAFATLVVVQNISRLVKGPVEVSLVANWPFWMAAILCFTLVLLLILAVTRVEYYSSKLWMAERELKERPPADKPTEGSTCSTTRSSSTGDLVPEVIHAEVESGQRFTFIAKTDCMVDLALSSTNQCYQKEVAMWIDDVRCIMSIMDVTHTGFMYVKAGSTLRLTSEPFNDAIPFRVRLVRTPV